MAGPVLIVELPTVNTTRSEVAALVQACTEGLGNGRCELSSNAEQADGIAVVSLSGADTLTALIEVGRPRAESHAWLSQEISFQPQDARVERFRTIGFAIATLYRERQGNAAEGASAGAEEPARSKPTSQKAERSPNEGALARADAGQAFSKRSRNDAPSSRLRDWLSAGPLAAYDVQLSSPLRWGGQLALGVAPLELPGFVILDGSYAAGKIAATQASPEVSLSWLTLGVGAGTALSLQHNLQLRLSAQGVLVQLEASGSDPERGQQESHRWLPGGQIGAELVAWSSRRWGVTLGSHAQYLTGATAISVRDRPIGTAAALSFQLGVALELRPFQL
jgi:hypothetical protein